MSKRTAPLPHPELLTLDPIAGSLTDGSGTLVAIVMPPRESDTARRLAACWNALRGVETPDIERGLIEVKRVTNHVAVGTNTGSIHIGGSN